MLFVWKFMKISGTFEILLEPMGIYGNSNEMFGDLWGHGLPIADLDDDQAYWRELWMETRSKVLDNGNANLRAAQNEISQYTLSWNRYVSNFTNRDK